MRYKKIDNVYVIRLDIGDEIVSTIMTFAEKKGINLANITGIGATNNFEIGCFNTGTKHYEKKEYQGAYEILSLIGNLTKKGLEPYLHLHMTVADESGNAFGGHLNKCIISATCEIFITTYEEEIQRKICDITGLNIFDI